MVTGKTILKSAAQEEGYKEGEKKESNRDILNIRKCYKKPDKLFKVQENDYLTYLETSEKTILDLAIKIAKKIIGTKIEENKDYFSALVKRALKEVKDFPEVQLACTPYYIMKSSYLKKKN